MKKLLLTLLAATGLLTAQAAGPKYVWNKLIDGPYAQDIVHDITVTTDGNLVTVSNFGSKTTADNVSIDGETIAPGANLGNGSTGENRNLLIMKQNATDGNKIWAVYSKSGDISVTSGRHAVVATSDGGILALVKFRSSDRTAPREYPVIIDASGAEVELPDWNLSEWIQYQILIKISQDGRIEWVRPIVADQLPLPGTQNATVDASAPGNVIVDSEGNIYIGGSYCAPLVFDGTDNSVYILTPRNIYSTTSSTSNTGGLYLVKLDSQGNYKSHLYSTSTGLIYDQIADMQLSGDKIYFAGRLEGAEKSTLTIGKTNSITLEKISAKSSLMLGAVEATDLKPVFIKSFKVVPTTAGNSRIKFMKLAIYGDNTYLTGSLTGSIAPDCPDTDNPSIIVAAPDDNKMLRAFIIKVSATDGTPAGGYMPNDLTGVSEFENAFEYDGKLYAVGYLMNAGTGSFIDEINPTDFTLSQRTIIAKGGGAPTLTCAHFDADKKLLVTATRGNNIFTVDGDKTTDKPQSWGSVVVCHSLADASGVNGIDADNGCLTITTEDGAVVINAAEKTDITVIDMQGRQVDRRTVDAGETRISLASGFYLVNNQKVAVK